VQRGGMEGFLVLADRPAIVGAARNMIAAGRCHALGVGGDKAIFKDSSASAARRSTASRLCRRVLQDRRPGLSRRAASCPCRDDLLTLAARSSRLLPSEASRRRRFQTARPIQFCLALRADSRSERHVPALVISVVAVMAFFLGRPVAPCHGEVQHRKAERPGPAGRAGLSNREIARQLGRARRRSAGSCRATRGRGGASPFRRTGRRRSGVAS